MCRSSVFSPVEADVSPGHDQTQAALSVLNMHLTTYMLQGYVVQLKVVAHGNTV